MENKNMEIAQKIFDAISKCFKITDTVWYDDTTTLYDQIVFILDDNASPTENTLKPQSAKRLCPKCKNRQLSDDGYCLECGKYYKAD